MRVDFHVHSTASDGTCSPSELADRGRTFAALAITDHDNCDGAAEFLTADGGGLRFAGIELSIDPGKGFDKFHLLGLGIDPANAELRTFLRKVLDGRNARNERICAKFRSIGIEMSTADLAPYAHGEVLARPHFARWLVDHRLAADLSTAFATYLLPDSPTATRCYEERWHPPQEEAFRIIHAAGGLCVMAHPKYWRRTWSREGVDVVAAERGLAELLEKGLDGVEALYEANTAEENVSFVRMATRLNCLKSAGSDFHGANKPTIALGMDVSEGYIAPLLERLGASRGTLAPKG